MAKRPKYVEIHEETLERFHKLYPSRGSFTWAVNALLEAFVQLRDTAPNKEIELAAQEVINSIGKEDEDED